MNATDALACAPPAMLAAYGVTEDNSDLLRPGPLMVERCRRRVHQLSAQKVLGVAGAMTVQDLREVLIEAASMLRPDNG